MDISASMNVHDLAMTKPIRQQADAQTRQEKVNQQIEAKDANQTSMIGNETPLEAKPGALTNTVEQQEDPQAATIRIERQVDAQAAKETAQEVEMKRLAQKGPQENGTLINIIT